jgi:DNA-binding transcriptional LysR family regulator
MRIEQLEYVCAVTQHGSLRRASEHLHVSQPAISEAITKLERELGVTLLDRRRSGARISSEGRELLRGMEEVLDAVARLKSMAGDQTALGRAIRLGTVNAGTARLVLPAVRRHRRVQPGATVEIRNLQQQEIHTLLVEGSLDVGLVNQLDGDDVPPDLVGMPLLRGRPVAVLPTEHPLAAQTSVDADDLRRHPFVGMRSGYLMHRFAHRFFGADLPADWHSTDGAEMGKMMVAEGLGVSLLPDFSDKGDPLDRAGVLTTRPLRGDRTTVTMVLLHRRRSPAPDTVRDLVQAFREVAAELAPEQVARVRPVSLSPTA